MSKWQLYITDNNGDGIPQELRVWDDEEETILELRLAGDYPSHPLSNQQGAECSEAG